MKRKAVSILTGVFSAALFLSGCAESQGLETDDITITQYKGVEVAAVEEPEEITDEDVEEQIQSTLETQKVSSEVTDRAVEDGDVVNIDFVGKIDGEEFDGGASEGYDLEIGSDSFIDGFEDSIIGHNTGDRFEWKGKFPDDYGNEEYAGKDVVFEITVNKISQEEIPELTDDLVAELSEESKTVEEYKEEVKKMMEEDAQASYDDELADEVWQKVMDNTTVKKYPDGEIDKVKEQITEQYKSYAEYYDMEYEDFVEQAMGMTLEDLETQTEEVARNNIQSNMAVEAIADKEKIEMSDDAYEAELAEIAQEYGYEDVDALKASVEDEEQLKQMALKNLVVDKLVESCIQVEE